MEKEEGCDLERFGQEAIKGKYAVPLPGRQNNWDAVYCPFLLADFKQEYVFKWPPASLVFSIYMGFSFQ